MKAPKKEKEISLKVIFHYNLLSLNILIIDPAKAQQESETKKVDVSFNNEFPANNFSTEDNMIQLPGVINYTHEAAFPREVDPTNMEMKTDSMLIEELLAVDRQKGGNEPQSAAKANIDQSWANFSKARENEMINESFTQTPSKTTFDQSLPLENGIFLNSNLSQLTHKNRRIEFLLY